MSLHHEIQVNPEASSLILPSMSLPVSESEKSSSLDQLHNFTFAHNHPRSSSKKSGIHKILEMSKNTEDGAGKREHVRRWRGTKVEVQRSMPRPVN